MAPSDLRTQVSLVEAKLFASVELDVIRAIDDSDDAAEAAQRLEALGMSAAEAVEVLEMPLRARTRLERDALFAEASRLRAQLPD